MTLSYIIIQIAVFSPLIPLLWGISRFKHLASVQRLLLLMIATIMINQMIAKFLFEPIGLENNLPFFHLYILLEVVFLKFIFSKIINSKIFDRFSTIATLLFGTIWLLLITFKTGFFKYPDYSRFIEGILLMTYSSIYFVKVFNEKRVLNLFKEIGFWVSSGVFVYFSSNSVLFLFSEFVVTLSDRSFVLIWTVHAVLTILLYIAYTIAIRCKTSPSLS